MHNFDTGTKFQRFFTNQFLNCVIWTLRSEVMTDWKMLVSLQNTHKISTATIAMTPHCIYLSYSTHTVENVCISWTALNCCRSKELHLKLIDLNWRYPLYTGRWRASSPAGSSFRLRERKETFIRPPGEEAFGVGGGSGEEETGVTSFSSLWDRKGIRYRQLVIDCNVTDTSWVEAVFLSYLLINWVTC
jgi:hypothetical protein